jgi:molecular chaperone GrpE
VWGEEALRAAIDGAVDDSVPASIYRAARQENEHLRASLADHKDRMIRLVADMDNLRKRTERERADASKYAVTKFAGDVLGVADDIQLAIKHVPAEDVEKDAALRSFLEGVQMLDRKLHAMLERHGVTRIIPQNEPFNPHIHQAVMEMDRPDVPAGTIVDVYSPGYMIADRVLRAAFVATARGGPKVAKAAAPPVQSGVESAAAPGPAADGEPPAAANDDTPKPAAGEAAAGV